MRFIYLASASNGNRKLLWNVGKQLARKHYVFAPCLLGLGDYSLGNEPPEMRALILDLELDILKMFDTLVVLYEGIKSEGIWEELKSAIRWGISSCILETGNLLLPKYDEVKMVSVFKEVNEVEGWLGEI